MAAGIDMSLDDLIKRSSSSASRRRFRGRPNNGPGPDRRFTFRKPPETAPYFIPDARLLSRQVFEPTIMVPEMVLDGGDADAESGTKLYISNLDYGVSNDDIKLLFSEGGELKRYSIHYDKSGRSKGTAEVVFTRQSEAVAAIKKYNNMKLDGKPLQIELVGTSLVAPAIMPVFQSSIPGRGPHDVLVSGGGRFEGSRFQNGFARDRIPRHRGEEKDHGKLSFRDLDGDLERYHRLPRGRGEVKGRNGRLTAKDLDDDLERYRVEAMQINKKNGK